MKKQLKTCKGFDTELCNRCKRQNSESKRLVKTLGNKNGIGVCQFYMK